MMQDLKEWINQIELMYLNELVRVRVLSGIISSEINNKFPEIFPCGNFWEFLRISIKNLEKITSMHLRLV